MEHGQRLPHQPGVPLPRHLPAPAGRAGLAAADSRADRRRSSRSASHSGKRIVGDPDECARAVQKYADVGCDQIIFGVLASTPAAGRRAAVGRAVRQARDPALRQGSGAQHDAHARGGAQEVELARRDDETGRRVQIVPARDRWSTACRCRWPRRARSSPRRGRAAPAAEEIRRIAQACDRNGFFYLAVSDHVVRAARARGGDVDRLVRHRRHPRLPRRGHPARAPAVLRLGRALPPPAGDRQGVRHARRPVGRPRHPRRRRRPPAGRVRGPRRRLRRRGKLLDEAIDADRGGSRPTSSRSTTARPGRVRDVGQRPRPVQRPRPPIWVGGSTKAALRRAAERGDGWLPQGVPEMGMPAAIAFMREHRRQRPRRCADRDRHEQRRGSTSASRPSTSARTPAAARPRSWPRSCAASRTSASSTAACAFAAARATS